MPIIEPRIGPKISLEDLDVDEESEEGEEGIGSNADSVDGRGTREADLVV